MYSLIIVYRHVRNTGIWAHVVGRKTRNYEIMINRWSNTKLSVEDAFESLHKRKLTDWLRTIFRILWPTIRIRGVNKSLKCLWEKDFSFALSKAVRFKGTCLLHKVRRILIRWRAYLHKHSELYCDVSTLRS